ARAGVPLTIAGPVGDRAYFERCLAAAGPQVRYAGHLESGELAAMVADAAVALVTPCWEEPFGLVAIEALACGTPVAGFARGALPEILDARTGALAAPGDVAAPAARRSRCRSTPTSTRTRAAAIRRGNRSCPRSSTSRRSARPGCRRGWRRSPPGSRRGGRTWSWSTSRSRSRCSSASAVLASP